MPTAGDIWLFTRERLRQAIDGLTAEQLSWRPHPAAHSIFELVFHIAGAEHYWASRMTGSDPAADDFRARLDRAVFEGFLRDGTCELLPSEQTPEGIATILQFTFNELSPIMQAPTPGMLSMPLISPIGDRVDGAEGITRLAQHAGYHTGQIWMVRMSPGFPV